jgi:hypothetical protein
MLKEQIEIKDEYIRLTAAMEKQCELIDKLTDNAAELESIRLRIKHKLGKINQPTAVTDDFFHLLLR